MLDLVWLIPALPARRVRPAARGRASPAEDLGLGGHVGDGGLVRRNRARLPRPAGTGGRSALVHPDPVRVAPARHPRGRPGLPRRPPLAHVRPVRHRRRRPDPPLLDRLHARRPSVRAVLHLPEPLRLLHADAGPGGQPAGDLPRVGGRRAVLLPADLVLVHRGGQRGRGQEGVHHQPDGRRGASSSPCSSPSRPSAASTTPTCCGEARVPRHDDGQCHRPAAVPRRGRASRPSSRCTSGCPTPWRAPRRFRPSSTPPRW